MNPELKKRRVLGLERVLAPRALWPGLLAVLLLISLGGWFLRPLPTRAAVLFFPRAGNLSLAGEPRAILPGTAGLEDSARIVVEELLLGPGDARCIPALPAGTRVRETLYRKGRLYVDLSEDAVFAQTPPLAIGLEAIKRTLKYNFPALGSMILTIDGREPNISGSFTVEDSKKKQK